MSLMVIDTLKKIFLTLVLLQVIKKGQECMTPFGAGAVEMQLIHCKPIVSLIRRYYLNLPKNERTFIQKSILPSGINGNQTMVCCDQSLNVTDAFMSVGAKILSYIDDTCGDNVFKRISFATETTFMTHPWSVLLIYNSQQRFQCGGSLISNRYVLTAAHCVSGNSRLIGVRLREHNISSSRDCILDPGGFEHCYGPVLDMGIEKVIPHENYSHITYNNDIALLRLDNDVKFDRSVRPICLPRYENQSFEVNYGTIIGWGATEKSTYSEVLLKADIPIHSLDHCRQIYRRREIDDMRLCAAGANGIDTCKGDSGGPLVIKVSGLTYGVKPKSVQIAIISGGARKCADDRNFPSVFLKLSSYRNWIMENIEL